MSGGQLLKIFSRNKTVRLSAEPLLDFFRPLETWLDQQNRNELVIGWNSNMDDISLYQPLHNICSYVIISRMVLVVTFIISGARYV